MATRLVGINHIALEVADLERTIAFYEQLFELRFRSKSISTYVYFLLWFTFSFLCVASENFGPVANANGKVLKTALRDRG